MTMQLDFYSDPGHGWLKVEKRMLEQFGIDDKISYYSYARGDYVYLEEDCDASLFIGALKDRGIEYEFKEHISLSKDSPIRNYAPYSF